MKHSYLKRLFVNSCVKSEFRKNKKLVGNTDVGSQQKTVHRTVFCLLLRFFQHFKTLEDAVLQPTCQRDSGPFGIPKFPQTFAIQPL